MSKEAYFEMCETMGSEPIEEEIPIEYDDFSVQGQEAIDLFNLLPDKWEGMSGSYLGKDITNIDIFFKLIGLEESEQLLIFLLFSAINNENIEQTNKKISQEMKSSNNKGANVSGGSNVNVRG